MLARIYRPAKNAIQSGGAASLRWLVEFEPSDRREPDSLMGWNGSRDTRAQLRLKFDTKEEAVAFAERSGFDFSVELPKPHRVRPRSYADNFRYIPPKSAVAS